jgi:fluoroacetyl-CoA thioesterase
MNTGLSHTSELTVEPRHTALALGSGDMEVLATPQMAALMENAAMLAVKDHLDEGSTTVGSMITTTHLRPTAVGSKVSATATLTAVEGRKLTFSVTAQDDRGVIGEGEHVRYIVDRRRFLDKL